MELKQAIEVVTQAINIAVGSGAFKNTKDVAVINTALESIVKFKQEQEPKGEMKSVPELSPKKLK